MSTNHLYINDWDDDIDDDDFENWRPSSVGGLRGSYAPDDLDEGDASDWSAAVHKAEGWVSSSRSPTMLGNVASAIARSNADLKPSGYYWEARQPTVLRLRHVDNLPPSEWEDMSKQDMVNGRAYARYEYAYAWLRLRQDDQIYAHRTNRPADLESVWIPNTEDSVYAMLSDLARF